MRGVFNVKRKKFVKMIMSRQWGRNSATGAAYLARLHGAPYFEALGDLLVRIDLCVARENGHDVRPTASCNDWLKSIDEAVAT